MSFETSLSSRGLGWNGCWWQGGKGDAVVKKDARFRFRTLSLFSLATPLALILQPRCLKLSLQSQKTLSSTLFPALLKLWESPPLLVSLGRREKEGRRAEKLKEGGRGARAQTVKGSVVARAS